eukprot:TRINITY_DN12992_c0_g1_i2.p1 TRINITY_DN12992_c0_g1~~TRINITY_DN12992_c0_g1_i2.p1  ORF type:complete len:239 (+),score=55.51 TRINITY_DN12992_c0_g1_i2:137-853(+)
MPPRKPGGKYKGLVGRAKSEAALANEQAEKARKKQEEIVARAAARKQKALMARSGFKNEEDPEEVRKQKILNMMMGGKKGNVTKFFKAWVVGTNMSRKERMILERETAWRKNCGECDDRFPGGCSACLRLGDTSLDFCLNNFLATNEAHSLRSTMGRSYRGTLKELPAISPSRSMSQLANMSSSRKLFRANFIEGEPETVLHYKNGQRYLLDTINMRIRSTGIHAISGGGSGYLESTM